MPPKTKAEKIKAAMKAVQPSVSTPAPVSTEKAYSGIELLKSLTLTGLIVALIVLIFALQKSNFIG
jgi:uncharacterized membrane protein